MSRVRGDGAGPRIAARLRVTAARRHNARKRVRNRHHSAGSAIAVHVTAAPPPPPTIIVVRDPRNPRAGWGR